jgi:hypothetical protein
MFRIDLNQYDHVDGPKSLRVSYSILDQCYYVHRDFSGPMQTLVRVCLLRVHERDLRISNLARRCLDELRALGQPIRLTPTTIDTGIVRLRHNDNARVLIARIAECIEHGDRDLCPSPTNPMLPDHEAMVPVEYAGQ